MKKKIIFIIIICILILVVHLFFNNKNKATVNLDVISEYLELDIPTNAKITYKDEHDSFFNEGYTIVKITNINLLDKIKKSSNWKKDDNEYTKKIKNIINTMAKDYNEISKIKNYYWLYKHNYDDKNIKYIEDVENIETYSYLLAIYDSDKHILYYYHMDM